MKTSLTIRAGSKALKLLRREGLSSNKVTTVAGAAGGPKWLILSQIDRVLFGEWIKPRSHPLFLVGSSIGSWRFSAVTQKEPLKAISAFEEAYLKQSYSLRPSAKEVSEVSLGVMNGFLDDAHIASILSHPFYRMNVMTIRCKNVFASERKTALLSGLAMAATGNAVHPRLLKGFFDRVVFADSRDKAPFLKTNGFSSKTIPLNLENFKKAVLASGSIPGVMEGVADIPGYEGNIFRDGGILDYHLDLPFHGGEDSEELILFPHFSDKIVPNWFDKGLPWRKPRRENFENVILIAPSREFISQLPLKKIPDRKDFPRFKYRDEERVAYWRTILKECQKLADELRTLLEQNKLDSIAKPFSF